MFQVSWPFLDFAPSRNILLQIASKILPNKLKEKVENVVKNAISI